MKTLIFITENHADFHIQLAVLPSLVRSPSQYYFPK